MGRSNNREPPRPKRNYTAADIGLVRLTGEAMVEICKKITAERTVWRKALGVPQRFGIPDDPLPATVEECRADMATVEKLGDEAFKLRCSLPPRLVPRCSTRAAGG